MKILYHIKKNLINLRNFVFATINVSAMSSKINFFKILVFKCLFFPIYFISLLTHVKN